MIQKEKKRSEKKTKGKRLGDHSPADHILCNRCKKKIYREDKVVVLGTFQEGKTIEKNYYHLECWKEHFDSKVNNKIKSKIDPLLQIIRRLGYGYFADDEENKGFLSNLMAMKMNNIKNLFGSGDIFKNIFSSGKKEVEKEDQEKAKVTKYSYCSKCGKEIEVDDETKGSEYPPLCKECKSKNGS
ncbi:MAG: hypothetical protein ACOC56_01470 [Atribacterota bacterium]